MTTQAERLEAIPTNEIQEYFDSIAVRDKPRELLGVMLERFKEAEAKLEASEHKANAYDAMCEVGLIQYGEDPETRVYSVWGFTCWHHDVDILKAIAAADKPANLQALEDKP